MNSKTRSGVAQIEGIFHPSDFSEASTVAFRHALKVALVTHARLSILHVSAGAPADWQDFPRVRDTLATWGLIPAHSPKRAVPKLGLDVHKIEVQARDPVQGCLEFLQEHPVDLIVLAVHQRAGKMRWLHPAVGTPVARRAGQMTLFLPHGVNGFVADDGAVSLRSILIPIAAEPRPQPAIEAVRRLVTGLNLPVGEATVLHVGPAPDAPAVSLPSMPGWSWRHANRTGDVVESIVQTAETVAAGLIVMTTNGRDGFLDALRGSTAERVLRQIKCPLLSLPAGSRPG